MSEANELYQAMNASIKLRGKYGRRLIQVRALTNEAVLPIVATITVGKKPFKMMERVYTLSADMELVEVKDG
jgi:hypothetical protein